MQRIHISRSRQNLGDFSVEEIRAGLANGRFFSTDLAWKEGMDTWHPLSTFDEFRTPEPPAGEHFMSEGESSQLPPLVPATGEAVEPAWERRSQLSFMGALIETVKSVLNAPGKTFEQMPKTGGLWNPFIFFFVVGGVSTFVALFFQSALYAVNPAELYEIAGVEFPIWYIFAGFFVYAIIIIPIALGIGIFFSAAITHLFLMLVGGAKQPFETTFRTLCYSYGAPSVLYMVPMCGNLIGVVWGIVASVIGLSKTHEISGWQAFLAIALPYFLICLCFFFIGFSLAGSAGVAEFINAYSKAE
ncbi:MAG: YIP1 family protein [Chthoniobacterales bacterium]